MLLSLFFKGEWTEYASDSLTFSLIGDRKVSEHAFSVILRVFSVILRPQVMQEWCIFVANIFNTKLNGQS